MKSLVAGVLLVLAVALVSAATWAMGYTTMPEDAVIVPVGVAGTSYEKLEPGLRGGTLYVSAIGNPKKWNAVTSHETSTTQFTNIMFPGLVSLDPISGDYVPELAKTWEVSADNLTITFHLRQGILWSDGTLFTADDVVFSYMDLYLNTDIETDTRDVLELPDGSYPAVEKVDESTVKFTLSVPFRPILNSLSANIMPKHKLASYVRKLFPDVPADKFNEVWGLDTDPAELVGLGAFMLESYTPDLNVVMSRNPYYYHYDSDQVQLPYLDKYVVLIVASQDVALLKFQNGELDCFAPRPGDIPILLGDQEAKRYVVMVDREKPVFGTTWFTFNWDTQDPKYRALFRDLRFREAVAHAIDKETMIQNLFNGLAVPQWSPVSYLSPFYAGRESYAGPVTERDAVVFEYSLSTTQALLDSIGIVDRNGDGMREFEDGMPVAIELSTNAGNNTREGACLILADDLKECGIKVTTNFIDFNVLVNKLMGQEDYQMICLGLTGGTEPHSGANVYRSTGGLHAWHYSAAAGDISEVEKRVDELIDLGAAAFDLGTCFDTYKEYQAILAKDLGLIYTVNQTFTYAYYSYAGNANVANPMATPSGTNGLTMDLIYLK